MKESTEKVINRDELNMSNRQSELSPRRRLHRNQIRYKIQNDLEMNVEREAEKRKRERNNTPLKNKKSNKIAIDDLILEAPDFGTNKMERREAEVIEQNEETINDIKQVDEANEVVHANVSNQPELIKEKKEETLKDRVNRCPIIKDILNRTTWYKSNFM